jgi:hypothetical protein
MGPNASLLMGKLFTCKQNHPTNEEFQKHCTGLALDCQTDQSVGVASSTPVVSPSSGSCEATCERLGKCDLAMPTCAYDCAQGKLDLTCLNAATTCDDRARCYLNQLCGRPVKTAGAMSCLDAMTCWGANANTVSDQCSKCYDEMSPGAVLAFARYRICWHGHAQETASDPTFDSAKAFTDRCVPLMTACSGIKSTP